VLLIYKVCSIYLVARWRRTCYSRELQPLVEHTPLGLARTSHTRILGLHIRSLSTNNR